MPGPYDGMPPLVDASGAPGGGMPGFIPPPPGAHREPESFDPFPGAQQGSPGRHPWASQHSPWPNPGGLSAPPWGRQQGSPISPYDPTPGSSWGGFTPASRGPATPASGFLNFPSGPASGSAQPVSPSPWFNGGGGGRHGGGWPGGDFDRQNGGNWPANKEETGPERRRPWPSPGFGGEPPLERSISNEGPGFGGWPGMRRSMSTGGAGPRRNPSRGPSGSLQRFNGFAHMNDDYGPDNLARRPKEWRPDYEARPLVPFIPKLGKPKSEVQEFSDTTKRTIHENLSYQPNDPHIIYDLRFPPQEGLDFPRLSYQYNQVDLAQLVTNPPVDQMRLFHPALPWYIDIVQEQPNGITIQDIIQQIHIQLDVPLISRHYYNEDIQSSARERMYRAFVTRANGNPEELRPGIKRVDFLEEKYLFVGLVRARNGHWEMKTKSPS